MVSVGDKFHTTATTVGGGRSNGATVHEDGTISISDDTPVAESCFPVAIRVCRRGRDRPGAIEPGPPTTTATRTLPRLADDDQRARMVRTRLATAATIPAVSPTPSPIIMAITNV